MEVSQKIVCILCRKDAVERRHLDPTILEDLTNLRRSLSGVRPLHYTVKTWPETNLPFNHRMALKAPLGKYFFSDMCIAGAFRGRWTLCLCVDRKTECANRQ